MGYNTVVLILNDYANDLMESPKTLAWAVTHPPMSDDVKEVQEWWEAIRLVAGDNDESTRGFRQGLVVMPTFHSSEEHYLKVGRNVIERVEQIKDN